MNVSLGVRREKLNSLSALIFLFLVVAAVSFFVRPMPEENTTQFFEKEEKYDEAKELSGISGYLNTDYISIEENIGQKVILIDFWTYSSTNCQQSVSFLNSLHESYADKGLLIIGVHTPEFQFEKEHDNLARAVQELGIKYPVVQDNDFLTWRAYGNSYWPQKYLVDIDGSVVYEHFGVGSLGVVEEKIVKLLSERRDALGPEKVPIASLDLPDFSKIGSPELYFGYGHGADRIGNLEGRVPKTIVDYENVKTKNENTLYLEGSWLNNMENMELVSEDGSVSVIYEARDVYLVAGSREGTEIKVYLDGEFKGVVTVSEFGSYRLIDGGEYGQHKLELSAKRGLMAYKFSFG